MSQAAPPPAASSGQLRRAALLVLAVGQVVASVLVGLFGGAFTTADRPGEPLIVPPGPAFSIWSLVMALCVGYAVWALPAGRADLELRNRLTVPLLVVFAGFSVWLAAAEIEPVWTTLAVFVVMLVGLLRALAIARQHRVAIGGWNPLARGLLWGMLGVYTGWSSIAIWLNLATAMAGSGAPVTGIAGTVGQLAVLAGATGTAVAIVRRTDGLLPYAAAVAWALGGAALGSAAAGSPVLSAASVVGLVVVAAAVLATRRQRSARRSEPRTAATAARS